MVALCEMSLLRHEAPGSRVEAQNASLLLSPLSDILKHFSCSKVD